MSERDGGITESPTAIPVTEEVNENQPEWMNRARIETQPCHLCHHADIDFGHVKAYLKKRGVTQTGDKPGENTISRDLLWGKMMGKLETLVLCRNDKSGSELCVFNATCPHWRAREDYAARVFGALKSVS